MYQKGKAGKNYSSLFFAYFFFFSLIFIRIFLRFSATIYRGDRRYSLIDSIASYFLHSLN